MFLRQAPYFIITKQSFLCQKDSIVTLLDSLSQLDITLSIISPIRRFSLQVVVVLEHIVAFP